MSLRAQRRGLIDARAGDVKRRVHGGELALAAGVDGENGTVVAAGRVGLELSGR
jgi:hypothetical protein